MKANQRTSVAFRYARYILILSAIFLINSFNAAASQLDIVGPAGSQQFGTITTALPNGNIIVTDPLFDLPGQITDVGAVYLYNGKTGALISTITGSTASDSIGGTAAANIVVLANGNYLIRSANWDNGAVADAGAVTFCSGTIGCSGVVSATNSLVGSTATDNVGSFGVVTLINGNYVVRSQNWDNGAATNVGAITFCNGTTGCAGAVTPTNSLVGSTAADVIGNVGVEVLPNNNYLVRSSSWDNGAATSAGAVSFCSGTTGCVGPVSATNSLVGSTASDGLGVVTQLSNGNYTVTASIWDNGATVNVGAVTFCSGTTGCLGVISAANSVIGSTANDGSDGTMAVVALTNGNYTVRMSGWDDGAKANVGAVRFCDGTAGCNGTISAANSLIGDTAADAVGIITPLTNNNYVVTTLSWDNGATTNVGAATWCSGTTGCTGAVTAANSLIGSTAADAVGSQVTTLTNGNYVVRSPSWDNGVVADTGATTWGNGATGTTGVVSVANSLVGSTASDGVGTAIDLQNGHYVVRSQSWDNGAATNAGAVTWCNGQTGATVGAVSAANSIIGSTALDAVGSAVAVLSNGNYVATATSWDNGAATNAGAVTWGNGSGGTVGVVSAANSLVGLTADNSVGGVIAPLPNGNYVVRSTAWDNGAILNVGAVTYGNGTTGTSGVVSPANSLVGTAAGDAIGIVTVLTNGNYVVNSASWDNGAITDAGAVTWCSGVTGCPVGDVTPANSLVGSTVSDQISSSQVAALPDGNYLVRSSAYDNGATTQAGEITFGAGNGGTVGAVSPANSVIGLSVGNGNFMVAVHDVFNETLIASRRAENIVTVLNPTFTSVTNGNWTAAATWDYGANTKMHDSYIPNGRTVNLNVIAMPNSLRIDCTGAMTGASATAYINGGIRKDFCATGAFTYPVGTANGYSPVATNITALTMNPSSLTVSATPMNHPALSATNSLKRYWNLTETGDLTANLTFNYLDPIDVSGIESTYELFRISGGEPTQISPATLNIRTNDVSVTGISEFSDWTLGNLFPSPEDGDIDSTFDNDGKSNIDFDGNPTPGAADSDFGYDVAIQADGKIVVSGESFITATDSVFSAVRLNGDGTIDTTFANNGKFIFNAAVGISERAYGIAVQSDGKIIIAGRTGSPRDRVVLRLNSDGSFDTTFGTNGVFKTPVGSPTLDEQEIAIQTDGKIIVIGTTRNGGVANDAFSVMRLNANGTLDTSFDGDGEAITVFNANDRALGVKLQSDGKIVVSGSSNNNNAMALARYNSDGSLDPTFDGDGRLLQTFPGATTLAQNLLIQPDNKIVAAGYSRTVQADAVLVRFNPNGSLDTSFSGDGIASFGNTTNELFWDLHWRNGKIIGTGFRALVDPSSIEDFLIVRFNGNGSLDTEFGTNGAILTDFNTSRDVCLSSAMQSDGKLVLAGYSGPVATTNPDFAVARYNLSSQKTPSDFDADGKSDLSVYRPINGGTSQWWYQNSSNNSVASLEWGLQTDVPTSADFDGDGKTDIAVWRPAPATQAAFYILNSANNTLRQEAFGQTGDKPIAADYDGDGKADLAVYRQGAQSVFYYRGSLNNPGGNTTYTPWGTTGDKSVVGDFNGDGKSDFTVFRSGVWWILPNGSSSYEVRNWGISTDKLVPGDYDGDGKTDLAVYRDGTWYIQNSSNGATAYRNWGISTDTPVPADYDGDGRTDVSVYRDGSWYVLQTSNSSARIGNLGTATDTPIPSVSIVP